jgi:hypothetical protein
VKVRHQAVDPIDLLLTLRDMLRDDPAIRAFYQVRNSVDGDHRNRSIAITENG